MNRLICGCLVSVLALSAIPDALAWRGGGGGGAYHGAYGGSAVRGPGGNWAAQGPRGSTASGNGHGSWNANGYRGGTASGSNGSWAAHGAYGGTAYVSRADTLLVQFILSRPEMRSFLTTRAMVPYKEAWMPQFDAMKTLQNWTDVSVTSFRDLAVGKAEF